MTFDKSSGNVFADLVKIANRTLFHLLTDEIRASFAKRDEGPDRNTCLYFYNPFTVELV